MMIKIRTFTTIINKALLLTTFCAASSSSFAVAIFTDRLAWEAAVSGTITTDTFSNDINNASSITLDTGITSSYASTGPANQVTNGVFQGFVNQTGQIDLEWDWDFSSIGNITAFGADFARLNVPNGLKVTGDFDGLGDQTISIVNAIGGGSGFFGLVGNVSFNTIIWSSNDGSGTSSGEFFEIDNFSFTAHAPEPSAFFLLGAGIAGLGFLRRKK